MRVTRGRCGMLLFAGLALAVVGAEKPAEPPAASSTLPAGVAPGARAILAVPRPVPCTPPKPEGPDVRSPASGGGLAQTAGDEIDRLAVELVERGRVESYGEALHQVVNDPQHRHTVEAWSRPGGS